jgi:hypothetical protein
MRVPLRGEAAIVHATENSRTSRLLCTLARMKTKTRLAPMLCLLAAPALAAAQNLDAVVNGELSNLVETYKGIHEHPELSHHEEHTAALLAGELRKAGFAVTERVGKYPDGTEAYGLVAILQNGPGPRLLIRTDMDALPIVEETGVVYASHVRTKNAAGQDVGVCMPAGTMCT